MRRLAVLLGGCVFGAGLAWSGMTQPEVVLAFLWLEDLGLLLVMGGAVVVTALAFQLAPRLGAGPLLADRYEPAPRRFDRRTVVGAVVFGLGWGVAGVCPGAALASLGTGNLPILYALGGMLAGAWLQGRFFEDRTRS